MTSWMNSLGIILTALAIRTQAEKNSGLSGNSSYTVGCHFYCLWAVNYRILIRSARRDIGCRGRSQTVTNALRVKG
jgi:hypothetical protein